MKSWGEFYGYRAPKRFEGAMFDNNSGEIHKRSLIPTAASFIESYGAEIVEKFVCSRCPFCENHVVEKLFKVKEGDQYNTLFLLFKCSKQMNEQVGFVFLDRNGKCEPHESSAVIKHCDILYKHMLERADIIATQVNAEQVDKAVEDFRANLPQEIAEYATIKQQSTNIDEFIALSCKYIDSCVDIKDALNIKNGVEIRKFDTNLDPKKYETAHIAFKCWHIVDEIETQLRANFEKAENHKKNKAQ